MDALGEVVVGGLYVLIPEISKHISVKFGIPFVHRKFPSVFHVAVYLSCCT
jgi:hypothetical protein